MKRQDELNEAWCKYMGKCSTEIIQALSFALRWCDEHPNWISVEDELPKDYESVLAAVGGNHFAFVGICLNKKTWYCNIQNKSVEIEGITHWMPTPQPPKKGGLE